MSFGKIVYKGFLITRKGGAYKIEKMVGSHPTLEAAKKFIDDTFKRAARNKSTSFHK